VKKIFFFLAIIFALLTFELYSEEVTIVASEDNIEELLILDPYNIDFLNIYSIKQKKEKNYLGAIQTLEKIINLDNTLLPFYLELARLQFIIYDFKNDKKNFLFVYNQNIPPNVKNNIRYYLRQIKRLDPASINYNFKISYNDNINNGTYADTVRLFGIPFKVNEEAKAKESYELFSDINGAYDFDLDGYRLNTGFLINHSNYAGSAYDRLKYGINIGPEHYYKGQKINWSLLLSREEMDNNPIVNSREIRVSNLFNYRPNIQIQSAVGMGETDYYNNANYNSDSKFVNFLINYIDRKNINYSANLILTDNDADYKPYGNEKKYFSVSIASELPRGFFANFQLGIEDVDYDAYQFMWLTTREDRLEFASFSLRNERLYIGNFYPQINITLRDNDSNVEVYKTSSDSVSMFFIKDF
jgi:hypothetical protein